MKWRRCGLLFLIAVVAGVAYAWGIDRDPLEPYYAAAVSAMAGSWHDFAFGAFDPAGTITLDKLPGAFWIQALSARVFGVHTWSLVLPQVVEGVLAVLVLYRAVRRLASPSAGLLAAAVLAISPAVVALDRGNISDSLMILLVVLAADAVAAAVAGGSGWWLVLAGVWVGLAFQAKMIEAWLVLPAFGLVVLLAAPWTLGRRIGWLLGGGVVAGVVSLAWMVAITLVPAGDRPYVDGSAHDSIFEQVFGYNGFGRFGAANPLQTLAGQGIGIQLVAGPPGPLRLFTGDLGRDAAWLVPAAIVIAVAGIVVRRREPRTDPERAAYVLWGAWLLTFGVAFSVTATINAYYTAVLAPATSALVGMGVVAAWRHRDVVAVRVGAAVLALATAGLAATLLAGALAPPGLALLVGVVAVVAAVLAVVSWRRSGGALPRATVVVAAVAVLVAPVVASLTVVLTAQGALDSPFSSRAERVGIYETFVAIPKLVAGTLPKLEEARAGAPYLAAAQSGAVASVFAYPSGEEVLPLGGFAGDQPTPTVDALRADVAAGKFHLVFAFPTGSDPRIDWIAAHCKALPGGPLREFYCLPANAR
jgi:4-amino-4-deoxy-L-arabinose transferase-like glycosyltransferase